MPEELKKTPIFDLHVRWGGKMTGFAGYELPLSYAGGGFIGEHAHTRESASLFDVSHMGQSRISGAGAAEALSQLCPADVSAIPEGGAKYTVLTNRDGGALDDCIAANDGDSFFVVFNASRKAEDVAHVRSHLPSSCQLEEMEGWALLALQGPKAEEAAAAVAPDSVIGLRFMQGAWFDFEGAHCRAARAGYTGEDGFEFSIPAAKAAAFAEKLTASGLVKPAGLGARDSLRLEAGLCLYGNELTEEISPVQAGLTWIIPKHRRGADAGYIGAEKIAAEIAGANDDSLRLFGLEADGKKVARGGAEVFADAGDSEPVGRVTSGVFSPSLQKPVALAFLPRRLAKEGQEVYAQVRGDRVPYRAHKPPFAPHRYKTGASS